MGSGSAPPPVSPTSTNGSAQEGPGGYIGDPTETSILVAAHKNGMEQDALKKEYPRLAEIPFDSDRKLMTTVNRVDGKNLVIVKGAFDVMADRCVAGDVERARPPCGLVSLPP